MPCMIILIQGIFISHAATQQLVLSRSSLSDVPDYHSCFFLGGSLVLGVIIIDVPGDHPDEHSCCIYTYYMNT